MCYRNYKKKQLTFTLCFRNPSTLQKSLFNNNNFKAHLQSMNVLCKSGTY
jgi:hypothetical protein